MSDDFAPEAPMLPIVVGDVALLPRVAMLSAPHVSFEVIVFARQRRRARAK